jgi:hypothetical protein
LSLITAFVITLQVILNLTSDDNLIAANYFVAYRTPLPDQKTVERVEKELEKHNIDINQLLELQTVECPLGESSTEELYFRLETLV